MLNINKILKMMEDYKTGTGTKRDAKAYPHIKFRNQNILVQPKRKIVVFSAESVPEIPSKASHTVVMSFHDMTIKLKEDSSLSRIVTEKGTFYINKPDKATPVKLFCDCYDFRFTWSWALKKYDSLYKAPIKYTRKTTTYPKRNQNNTPGVCKHLWNFFQIL